MSLTKVVVLIVVALGILFSNKIFHNPNLPRGFRFRQALSDLGMSGLLIFIAIDHSALFIHIATALLLILMIYTYFSTRKYRKDHLSK